MRLLINGRAPGSKRSKHINIKYLFATDVIKHGDMSMEQCLTEEMWVDINTKPLQGKYLMVMRSKQMNMTGTDIEDKEQANDAKIAGVPRV